MHAAVAVRVLVVVAAVALLWTLSPLVGSQEDPATSAPVTASGPAGTERAVPGGPPVPVEGPPAPVDIKAPGAPAPVEEEPPAPALVPEDH
jgi:hypothetical protein